MGEWTILERLLEAAVQQHSTMIGRILLTVMVIFRILIVAIVGETVYEDEQSMFTCNTLQPGCNQACYDRAFPISHIRYWVFQIIMVCTPSLCFITYSVHKSAKNKDRPLCSPHTRTQDAQNLGVYGLLCARDRHMVSKAPRRPDGLSRFYILQVVFRNTLELGFLVGQYVLYGFRVPRVYQCARYPCFRDVECYVSRPTEKTVFLVFMFGVSGICVLLNLAELNHLGWRKIKAAVHGARVRHISIHELKTNPASHVTARRFTRTQSADSAYV